MIYVAVALAAEARPLVAHFQLEKADGLQPLAVFRRSNMALIVAGVGKEAMAAAVDGLAAAAVAEDTPVWLNIGVAGHRDHEIGTAVLASRVVEEETEAVHPLSPPADLHLPLGEIRSVVHVETRFETPALYEMEAAAFCERTAALTSPELIQVLKIVSDNRASGTLCVSARQVQGLVEENLPKIDLLVSTLHRLARQRGQ
jgi:hypothetical protein